MVDVCGMGEGFEVGTQEWQEVAALPGPSRAGTGAAGRPNPSDSAKSPAAREEAPGAVRAQGAWEGDRLEPALTRREKHRLGELANSGTPCPGNGAMGPSRVPLVLGWHRGPHQLHGT